jgi:hypothetical protein
MSAAEDTGPLTRKRMETVDHNNCSCKAAKHKLMHEHLQANVTVPAEYNLSEFERLKGQTPGS